MVMSLRHDVDRGHPASRCFPNFFLGLFIDLNAPENPADRRCVARARSFVSILWVLIDGVYVAALGLPRATDDNRFAMLAVPFVYWGLGLSTAYLLSSTLQLGLIGFWYAFVLALTVNAMILIARFAWVSRLHSRPPPSQSSDPALAAADPRHGRG